MYEVYLWVPTKGWKLLVRTRSCRKAVEKALVFRPLEVKMSTPSGINYYEGYAHNGDFSDNDRTEITALSTRASLA
jgi:hypothetical protein